MPTTTQPKSPDSSKPYDPSKTNFGQGNSGDKSGVSSQPGQRPDQSNRYGQKNPQQEDEEEDGR